MTTKTASLSFVFVRRFNDPLIIRVGGRHKRKKKKKGEYMLMAEELQKQLRDF